MVNLLTIHPPQIMKTNEKGLLFSLGCSYNRYLIHVTECGIIKFRRGEFSWFAENL